MSLNAVIKLADLSDNFVSLHSGFPLDTRNKINTEEI